MKIGSQAHKELFCRSFLKSYQSYEAHQLMWPELDGAELERLRQIPFWEEALNTELEAGAKVDAYTSTITDPLVQDAIALQGVEEARHGRLFKYMIERYGIKTLGTPPAPVAANVEQAFIDFGYGECVDAFLGFGLFKIARQSQFLPESMFSIFDLLLQEEARHIVFFVNWVAYLQINSGRGSKFQRGLTSVWNYGKAIQRLMGVVNRSSQNNSSDFAATEVSVFLDDFNLKKFISTCLEENSRRMNCFDDELIKPQFLPVLSGHALSVMR